MNNEGQLYSNAEIFIIETKRIIKSSNLYKFTSDIASDGFNGSILVISSEDRVNEFYDIINSSKFYDHVLNHIEKTQEYSGSFGVELFESGDSNQIDFDGNTLKSYKFIRIING